MKIDVEKLVIVLRMYREDIKKISNPLTHSEDRKSLCIELGNSMDKLITKLNDKRISVVEGIANSTQSDRH